MAVSSVGNPTHIEIRSHPACLGISTTEEVDRVLVGKTSHTYVLWIEDPNQLHLSYVTEINKSQNIIHSVFSRTNEGWFYQNYDLHHTSSLEELIPKILHCDANLCKPLPRPTSWLFK